MINLIIIRGNSGSGKSTVAKRVQKRLGPGTMRIAQDEVRREMLYTENQEIAMDLIYQMAMYGNHIGVNVIIEGILSTAKNDTVLHQLINDFNGRCHAYYFDLPFGETLRRHQTKPNKDEFGEQEMADWFHEKDYLGADPETIIDETMSEDDIVAMICRNMQS